MSGSAPSRIFLGALAWMILASGCSESTPTPPFPDDDCELIARSDPVSLRGVELGIGVFTCAGPAGEWYPVVASAQNGSRELLFYWNSCAGNDNPSVLIKDEAGGVYDPLECVPRPLCLSSPELQALEGGSEVTSLVPFKFCRFEGPPGIYRIAASFTFYEDSRDGTIPRTLRQEVEVFWDGTNLELR